MLMRSPLLVNKMQLIGVCVAEAGRVKGALFSVVFLTAEKGTKDKSVHLNINSFQQMRNDLSILLYN